MLTSLNEKIDQLAKLAGEYKPVKEWGPYNRNSHPGDKRQIVIVLMPDGAKRTKSYPKHLVEKRLGRELDVNETVDHKDYDVNNNDEANLAVVDRKEHSAMDTRRVKLVEFECPSCHKKFERSPRLIRDKAKGGKTGPFCSKSCAARYTRQVQLGQVDKAPVQQGRPSEYFRRKLLQQAAAMTLKWGNDIVKFATSLSPEDEDTMLSELDELRDTVPVELWRKHKHREVAGVQWRPTEDKSPQKAP
jgi:hypothetical protein